MSIVRESSRIGKEAERKERSALRMWIEENTSFAQTRGEADEGIEG